MNAVTSAMYKIKLKKKTRMVVSGIAIAVASIYAIAISYDLGRAEIFSFFTSSVLLILAIMAIAIGAVFTLKMAARLIRILARKL